MAILDSGRVAIITDINTRFGLDIKLDELAFENIRVPTTETEIAESEGLNTTATIVALPGAPGVGKAEISWDRPAFSTVFTGPEGNNHLKVAVDLANVTTAKDVAAAVNYFYGYDIQPEDVEPYVIEPDGHTVRLVATPDSLGWTGETTVTLVDGPAQLKPNFTNVTGLTPFSYPYYNVKLGSAAVYGYPYRFDDYAKEFLAAGLNIDLVRLASILANVTGDGWEVWRIPSKFNLKEAKVSYNGVNNNTLPSNPLAQYVMVIDLSLYCVNVGGQLILHYTDLS